MTPAITTRWSWPFGRGRRVVGLLALPAAVCLAWFFFVPLADLLWRSVSEPTVGTQNYTGIFRDDVTIRVLKRTFIMSAVVTVVTLLLGYPYALVMSRVSSRARTVLLAIVLMPYWTSLMARTFAWVVLLQENGPLDRAFDAVGLPIGPLQGTTTGVTVAMCQVLLPFMVLPLYSGMVRIDPRLPLAAQSLGAPPRRAFVRVFLPLSAPAVVAGSTLVFILTLGFYVTPALVGSPQQAMISQLISVQVSRLLNFGVGGAMSVVLLVITLVVILAVSRVARLSRLLGIEED